LQAAKGTDFARCVPDSTVDDLVLELPSGRLHLQNDADYRRYCILIFRRHAVEVHDLSEEERRQWIEDVARMGRALTEVMPPRQIKRLDARQQRFPTCTVISCRAIWMKTHWGHPPQYHKPVGRRPLEWAL